MIIDVHTHIFPAAIRDHRESHFHGEPSFELLYRPAKARLAGAADLISEMDNCGVDKSVIFGFPWRSRDRFSANNDYILASVARYPDRLIGLCCFDLAHPDAPKEAERCLNDGMSGVGELAFYENGIDAMAIDRLKPIMALCRDKDRPVLIHTNEPVGHQYPGKSPNTLSQIFAVITAFPENRIILAHWGGGLFFYAALKKEVKERFKHVYFDTAASPFLYDPKVYRLALQTIGRHQILFGSDFPLISPSRYWKEFQQAELTLEERHAISGRNAAALFNVTSDT